MDDARRRAVPAVSPASPRTTMRPPAFSQPTSAGAGPSTRISVLSRHMEPTRWPGLVTWNRRALPSLFHSGPPMSCWPDASISNDVSPLPTASSMARSKSWVDMRCVPCNVLIVNMSRPPSTRIGCRACRPRPCPSSHGRRNGPTGNELLPMGAISLRSSPSNASM